MRAGSVASRAGHLAILVLLAFTGTVRVASAQAIPPGNTLDPQAVQDTIRRVADWQLAHPVDQDPRDWQIAPLYSGLIDASFATGDPRYLAAVLKAGMRIDFLLGSRTYHADGHAAGHSWLQLYRMDPDRDPDVLEPFIEQFNEIVEHPIEEVLRFSDDPPEDLFRTDRWSWADALYMSPPTIALLARLTGDQRYFRFIDAEMRLSYDMLYDRDANFFYRDDTYIDDRTPNGAKVFWLRGNGWVHAGLSLLLQYLPSGYPTRCFYVQLFREMSRSIVAAQQPDGFWYPSLLDPQQVPVGETSGSALFVSALARGVRLGVLDANTYWPSVTAGWNALLTNIGPDGAVVGVQPAGERPEPFPPENQEPYGTGAVLLAGSEIVRALGAAPEIDEAAQAALLMQADALVEEVPDLSTYCEDPCGAP